VKAFDVAAFAATDRGQPQRAARELGHGLLTRPPAEIARIRRELAELAEQATTDRARGFFDAIEHLLAGASAEAKHRRNVDEDVNTARLRKNAVKILVALHAGCELPSKIAEKTGLKLPAVSTELGGLEEEGFIDTLEPREGEDRRTSPRSLTMRGLRVAEELLKTEVSPTAEAVRELAPVFLSFIDRLADEGCVGRDRLREIAAARLGPVNGQFVSDEFLLQAISRRVVSHVGSAFALTAASYSRRWLDALDEVLRSTTQSSPVLQQLVDLSRTGEVWLRATAALRDRWFVALRKHQIRNVRPWCFDDARTEQLPVPAGGYIVIWENPEIMTHDLGVESLRSFVTAASRRYCYAELDLPLPPEVERLTFDAHHVE
jgi:DNA-binding MarR family transcriptional regulator